MKHDAMLGTPPSSVAFRDYPSSVAEAMDQAGAARLLDGVGRVVLKPNLVNASPFPVTTPPALCEAVIAFIRRHGAPEIIIAEGCGDAMLETDEVFARLGYDALAARCGVGLLDLNHAPLIVLEDPARPVFPVMHLPAILFDCLLISLPVLKAHSLADVTGSLKNMMGAAPPQYYGGRYGSWKKAAFHGRMQQSITDLVAYRPPDFAVMDATVGLADYHLGGRWCDPPVNRILAGGDPWELDREAARLLGLDWRTIGHLADRP
ncbi:MAG: DUF362 domain-containing protein [Desulfovibrionaceae bacterium]